MTTTPETVRARLAHLPAPGGTGTLVESGALDVAIRDGRVYVAIAIDPKQAVAAEGLRREVEAALRDLPGGAVVTLTAEVAPGAAAPAPLRSVGGGHAHPGHGPRGAPVQAPIDLPGVRHIIAVASGKGGVGKSTTAANLAIALAKEGLEVGLMDADVYGPSVPRLLQLAHQPELDEMRRMKPLRAYGIAAMSIGFLLDEEAAVVWRGPMVMSAVRQMLKDVDWGTRDVLVVDMPPGTGDAQLTLAQSVKLSGAVVVSTPQDLALIDARRAVTMFRKVDVPILGLVENMSTFICPHCGTRSDIFGHGGARHDAERLGIPFLGEIPLDMAIRETSDAGTPIVAAQPDGPHAGAYRAVARQVAQALSLSR